MMWIQETGLKLPGLLASIVLTMELSQAQLMFISGLFYLGRGGQIETKFLKLLLFKILLLLNCYLACVDACVWATHAKAHYGDQMTDCRS